MTESIPYENFQDHVIVEQVFKPEELPQIDAAIAHEQHRHISTLGDANAPARQSGVAWLYRNPETQWLFDRLDLVMEEVNKAFYGYDISEGYQAIQVTDYEPGQYYDWHMDYGPKEYFNRKLSMSVQISDPADYEGGELHFFRDGRYTEVAPKDFGTGVVFPTWVQHKAGAVTKGFRRSLVAWYLGPPWR